jgi:hypothetical protein
MPANTFFTVKTYVEPATLKEVFRGRSTQVLFFAQNLGNTPTGFTIEHVDRPGLSVYFYDRSGNLSLGSEVPLAVNQSRLFAMSVTPLAGASSSVFTVNPTFRNASAGITVGNLYLSINVVDPPALAKTAELGTRLSVDFTGVTESGLLFDTNMFGMLPLIDQKQRPTHPLYVKPSSSQVTPYEFTLQAEANYTNTEHKGFEPFLQGFQERESAVFWLTPDQTDLPVNAYLKDEVLVFEVRVTVITAG